MDPERWRQVEELFHAALALEPESQPTFIQDACGTDVELRRELESLLARHEQAESFLETNATETLAAASLPDREFGPYRILAPLGVGGMGEVYRARDSKLDRDVALKKLPAAVAGDPERLARFRREARTLASLNHPNIAGIHGLEECNGTTLLVLELVEGEPLRGPLPVDKALDYARQIAEALEAAHEKAIIHRDLKPANLKVTPQGRVKVLDFGLAKVVRGEEESQDLLTMTPVVGAESVMGQIVGTPPYMSPEQARGKEVDRRTDIWAFGCVLYELLTGKRAFRGDTLHGTIVAVLEHQPDWSALPAKTPARIRVLLRRCLDKDAARRLPDIRSAREEIDKASRRSGRWMIAAAVATGIAAASVSLTLLQDRRPPGPDQWVQLTRLPDPVGQPALSPDGRTVAFVRGASTFVTPGEIWVKTLPDGEAVQLTNDGLPKMSPVFSPDGSRIAYTVQERGKWNTWQVSLNGSKAKPWLENVSGLVWTARNRVMFSQVKDDKIHMAIVAAQEGRAETRDLYVPATRLGMAHRSYLSPNGKWVLIVEMLGRWLPCRLVPADGKSPGRSVGPPGAPCTFAAWSPDGKWMYLSSSAGGAFHIWRQRFPDGNPEQITAGPTEEDGIAMAPDGRSFVTAVASRQSAVWIRRLEGERQISLEGFSLDPVFTPDGKKLLYRILQGGSLLEPSEVRVHDLETGLTEAPFPGVTIVGQPSGRYDVSRDGRQAAVAGFDRAGTEKLYLTSLDRPSTTRLLVSSGAPRQPRFGPKGELYFHALEGSQRFLFVFEEGRIRKVSERPILGIRGVSPDARWVVTLATAKDEKAGMDGRSLIARSLIGEADIRLTSPTAPIGLTDMVSKWSPDGRAVSFVTATNDRGFSAKVYSWPLKPGNMFPQIPAGGFRSEADMAKVPGVRVFDVYDYAPGPSEGVYAFTRESVQRNLYRVPIP